MRVLLVEENSEVLKAIESFLIRSNYLPYCVSSVSEALKVLDSFDLVITSSFKSNDQICLGNQCVERDIFCIYFTAKSNIPDEEYWSFDMVVGKPSINYLIKILKKSNLRRKLWVS